MNVQVIGVVLLLFAVAQVKSDGENNTSNGTTNEVKRPQLGSLQKLVNVGKAYSIPEGVLPLDFYDNQREKLPGEVQLKSDNYPKAYPVKRLQELSISVEDSIGIEVIIHDLDIDPQTDFLKLSPVKDDGTLEDGMLFTGVLKEPVKLRLLRGGKIKLEFGAWTQPNHKHRGFMLTYVPYNNVTTSRKPAPERIVPFDKLPSLNVLLIVPEANQTTKTWDLFRKLLCNATNKFLEDSKLELEQCQPENITIKAVVKCPDHWPHSAGCIDLSFAVRLYALDDEEAASNPILRESRDPAGLRADQLEKVWARFGKSIFSVAGVPEYNVPDTSSTITLWIGIALGIVGVTFVILVAMCRLSNARDYWPSSDDDKQNILKNSPEMDISMFPSPDQVVPPLFPLGVTSYSAESGMSMKESTERGGQEIEALRKNSSTELGAYNQGFVEDEEHLRKRPNYQTFVEGVITDEATT